MGALNGLILPKCILSNSSKHRNIKSRNRNLHFTLDSFSKPNLAWLASILFELECPNVRPQMVSHRIQWTHHSRIRKWQWAFSTHHLRIGWRYRLQNSPYMDLGVFIWWILIWWNDLQKWRNSEVVYVPVCYVCQKSLIYFPSPFVGRWIADHSNAPMLKGSAVLSIYIQKTVWKHLSDPVPLRKN